MKLHTMWNPKLKYLLLARVAFGLLLILAVLAWRLPTSLRVKGSGGVTEATWSAFSYYELTTTGGNDGMKFIPANNHTLKRFLVAAEYPPFLCTTNAVVAIKDLTTGAILTSVTVKGLSNDSGAISVSMTGGHTFAFETTTGAKGCQAIPGSPSFTAVYQ